jgi:uncharacterized protein YbjT (DUF2867 family)
MIVVAGATGMLGREICNRLADRGERVRALVRRTSDSSKVACLRELGAEIVAGDLREPASLDVACAGASAVITTVSAMPFSYEPGANDIATTDLAGTRALIRAARDAGVGHFVYTSFSANLDLECPLRNAKRAVEATLRASGMRYTILRPSAFMEVWLSPAVGFDYPNNRATIYGVGERPISYIAIRDVAEFAIRSLTEPAARNATLELGGPEAVAPLDAVRIFERISGRPFELTHVPEDALVAQQAAATDEMAQTFPALMRGMALGDAIPMAALLSAIPVELTAVVGYAEKVLGKTPAHTQ